MWVLLLCCHCAEWLSRALWASALVPFAFLHRCHSSSLCIVNGVCRCAVLVLPVSGFCWCPLIICLLIHQHCSLCSIWQSCPWSTQLGFHQYSRPVQQTHLERPTCLLISHSICVTGVVSLMYLRQQTAVASQALHEIWCRWLRGCAGPSVW